MNSSPLHCPSDFIARIEKQFKHEASLFLAALEHHAQTSIRLNTAKHNFQTECSPVAWCKNAFVLNERPNFALDPLWHAGAYYVQEASSMFLEQIFKQIESSEPQLVLDLCAAPGGKSTQLNSLIKPSDLLVANELIKSRVPILHENLTKWGLPNHIISNSDPKQFANANGMFDVLLIDAPCSGEGLFRRDANAMNEWSIDNTQLCEVRQQRILSDSIPCLKEGGYLIYSTCTFNPGENEENMAWLCREFGFESIRIPLSSSWNIDEIEHQNTFGYRFLPHKVGGEGFFIALLRKTTAEHEIRFSKKDRIIFTSAKDYPTDWLNNSDDFLIFQHKEQISFCQKNWVKEISLLQKMINITKFGTPLASCIKNSFNPESELSFSTVLKSEAFSKSELSHAEALQFLAKENPELNNVPKSWQVMTFKDVPLGFIKGLGSRYNNYYPKEWRLRTNNRDNLKLWHE